MAPIINAYNRHRSGLFNLSLSYPKPSCAVVEAMDILHINRESAHYRAQERALKESSHG